MVAVPLALLTLMLPSNPSKFAARELDWRVGPVVYQVFVDRFAPSTHLDAKRSLYASPRTLLPWTETPKAGSLNREVGLWSHELAFWGGDLQSVRSKVPYLKELGADVLYLNPIFDATTNHKYDALDYEQIAPEYGTRDDLIKLAGEVHRGGMRLMLDGVFNHMGRRSPKFQDALSNPKSPYRDWFFIDPKYPLGYRAWINVANLPELRLENERVRRYLWNDPDSIVQRYLKDGADGWRLDTAFELGPTFLGELTRAAHRAKPGSEVVGEVWNYPEGWAPPMDGVMNFHFREILLGFLRGDILPSSASRMLAQATEDTGLEGLLRSWLVLDNHDTERLTSLLPDAALRRMAIALNFSLPGAPVVYYGSELGMAGGGDPENRAPMRWDLNTADNETLAWTKRLIGAHKRVRSLRVGDFRTLETAKLLAFMRLTDRVEDTAIVVANGASSPVRERVPIRDGRIMNGGVLRDQLSNARGTVFAGMLDIQVPAKTVRIFVPDTKPANGYSSYKRINP